MEQSLVSVVIATHNRCNLLKRALDSVVNQTYKNLEIIIGDNHSTDGTEKLCREYAAKDSRIKYFRHKRNMGMPANANFVTQQITGEYWTGIGDDDWFDLDFIEKLIKILIENPDCSCIAPVTKLYDENEDLIEVPEVQPLDQDSINERVDKFVKINFYNFISNCVYRTSVLRQLQETDGGVMEKKFAEDWLFIIKYLVAGKCIMVDGVYYNKTKNGVTRDCEACRDLWDGVKKLTANNFFDMLAKALSKYVLTDEFFNLYLNKDEKKELSKIVFEAALYYKGGYTNLEALLLYMWQHPLFLFRKGFYKRILSHETVQFIRYMWRHPLFLFRKDFYKMAMEHDTRQIIRYMWRHPLFLLRKDFYNQLLKLSAENSDEKLVSVTIQTYNRYGLLKKTLDSVVNQTYKNLEIIIGDNHSEDGTEELCREYAAKDSRIKYFRHDKNIGMEANGDFVTSQITGDYWTGVCDDDWFDLDYIEKSMMFMLRNPDYSMIVPLTKLYDEEYNLIKTSKPLKLDSNNLNKRVERFIKSNLNTIISCGLYRIDIFHKMKELDGNLFKRRLCEDWIFMLKHVVAGKCEFLYNVHYNKLHNGITKDLEASKAFWEVNDLTYDNFWDKLGESLSSAILEDGFFKAYLSENECEKLAEIANKAALSYKMKEVTTYIKRHPFFLFRKKFWNLLRTNLQGT